jgi:copper chaperone
MFVYRIDEMTCGHCASIITKAVRVIDPGATVEIDLAQHLVRIVPAEADGRELSAAIAQAGYTPTPVEPQAAATAATRTGCCCGTGGSGCRS